MPRTTFKIHWSRTWEEYQVRAIVDGKIDPGRTYFTDDLEDAEITKRAMEAEEERNRCQGN